eukprot:CAMPEP_0117663616 /NCGR_PEP_ID=MMETSP0804-20121206/8722_1 /TAXON_ID=1074897 /ORGANISM="Tetraselmis astigmatica, Strain CCMP880" /LENGTH=68 /DNA_ID=CAMNT_0005470675 /DNA_START=153 /DNA_END=359 /DNA_ORIENTATION=-
MSSEEHPGWSMDDWDWDPRTLRATPKVRDGNRDNAGQKPNSSGEQSSQTRQYGKGQGSQRSDMKSYAR